MNVPSLHLFFQITLVTSYPNKSKQGVSHVDVGVPIGKYSSNKFQNRNIMSSIGLIKIVPDICVQALGSESIQKLNISEYDVIFQSAFINDCFASLYENTKVINYSNIIFHIHLPDSNNVTYFFELLGKCDFSSSETLHLRLCFRSL